MAHAAVVLPVYVLVRPRLIGEYPLPKTSFFGVELSKNRQVATSRSWPPI